ncbi:MAG: hypothetical protein WB420_19575 [Bradyrhizobium sp.]|jgi:hypothetical protein
MAIATPAYWLVLKAMLVGKCPGAYDASLPFLLPQRGMAKPEGVPFTGEASPG